MGDGKTWMKRSLLVLISAMPVCVIVVVWACGLLTQGLETTAVGQVTAVKPSDSVENCSRIDIRYLEITNYVIGRGGRQIDLFMDEREFSKEKLTTLFSTFSKWYPEERNLTIVVYTNWDQVPALKFGPACPAGGISGTGLDKNKDNYKNAYYARREGRAYFSYSLDPPSLMSGKIELK